MQFVADENVPRKMLERLRTAGYDVVSIQETLSGISDRDVLKVAESQSRILVTQTGISVNCQFATGSGRAA